MVHTYYMFIDNPTPSLNETMRKFHSAVLVVMLHAAGQSNVLFSRPGTMVIEGVQSRPNVNLCFACLCALLGHRWHGLLTTKATPSGYGSHIELSASHVEVAVRHFLDERIRGRYP